MRTDIHAPKSIVPSDYQFVAFEHLKIEGIGDCFAVLENRRMINEHMKRTGGTYSGHEHGGNCHICGAAAIYTVLFYHAKTNVYIRTGQDCADKMEMSYDDMNAFRRAVQDAREAYAGKKKAWMLIHDRGFDLAWDIYTSVDRSGFKYEELTASDIVSKLVKYGSITDPTWKFLAKLVYELIPGRAAKEAQRLAETLAAEPVPVSDKRITIEGTVLSIKGVDTSFGHVTKLLVKSTQGFKVWGTTMECKTNDTPARFVYPRVGDRIKFNARIEPSKDDAKFGFFSRPTKGAFL